MKRDMDLVRSILLQVEANEDDPRGMIPLDIPGKSPMDVSYHVMLMAEAGLITAHDLSSSSGYNFIPKRLTWSGHEFLDAARNETVWNETKMTVAKKAGTVSFEVLKALLSQATLRLVGM